MAFQKKKRTFAYLLSRFGKENNVIGIQIVSHTQSEQFSKVKVLNCHHEFVEHFEKSSFKASACGLPVAIKCGQKLRLHLLLLSYVARSSVANDLLCVIWGSQTIMPSHIWTALKKTLSNCARAHPQPFSHTTKTRQKFESYDGSLWCKKTLKMFFFLHSFQFLAPFCLSKFNLRWISTLCLDQSQCTHFRLKKVWCWKSSW